MISSFSEVVLKYQDATRWSSSPKQPPEICQHSAENIPVYFYHNDLP